MNENEIQEILDKVRDWLIEHNTTKSPQIRKAKLEFLMLWGYLPSEDANKIYDDVTEMVPNAI